MEIQTNSILKSSRHPTLKQWFRFRSFVPQTSNCIKTFYSTNCLTSKFWGQVYLWAKIIKKRMKISLHSSLHRRVKDRLAFKDTNSIWFSGTLKVSCESQLNWHFAQALYILATKFFLQHTCILGEMKHFRTRRLHLLPTVWRFSVISTGILFYLDSRAKFTTKVLPTL